MNYIKYNHLNPASYHAFEPGEGRTSNSDLDSTVLCVLATGVVILILISIYNQNVKLEFKQPNKEVEIKGGI
jgi:hypothetical protein